MGGSARRAIRGYAAVGGRTSPDGSVLPVRRPRVSFPLHLSSPTGPGVRARRGRRTRWPPQRPDPRPRDAPSHRARRPRTRRHQPQPRRRLRRSLDAAGPIVGEGCHQRAGGPHAEIHALRAAGERARGGTAYVTLEPCNHTGRTGPCAQALIDAGIARVVYAVADPNPGATGGAAAAARGRESTCRGGLLAAEAEAGQRRLADLRTPRPPATSLWKYAATLDGRVAAADGTSRWITSAEARADVHRLRAERRRRRRRLRHRPRRRPAPGRARRRPAPSSRCGSSSTPAPPPYGRAPASWTTRRPP